MFSSELQQFTGVTNISVEAGNYREMIAELCAAFPKLRPETLTDMAVAIDGVIIVDPLLEPLTETSEVHFLHFVAGGF